MAAPVQRYRIRFFVFPIGLVVFGAVYLVHRLIAAQPVNCDFLDPACLSRAVSHAVQTQGDGTPISTSCVQTIFPQYVCSVAFYGGNIAAAARSPPPAPRTASAAAPRRPAGGEQCAGTGRGRSLNSRRGVSAGAAAARRPGRLPGPQRNRRKNSRTSPVSRPDTSWPRSGRRGRPILCGQAAHPRLPGGRRAQRGRLPARE